MIVRNFLDDLILNKLRAIINSFSIMLLFCSVLIHPAYYVVSESNGPELISGVFKGAGGVMGLMWDGDTLLLYLCWSHTNIMCLIAPMLTQFCGIYLAILKA